MELLEETIWIPSEHIPYVLDSISIQVSEDESDRVR